MDISNNNKNQNFDSLLQNNPLTQNLKIIVNKLEDKKTFENFNGILLHKQYYFERQRYTKIYIDPSNRKIIAMLSNNAIRLFYWLSFEIENNKDYIKINKCRYLKENNIKSVNTYKKALTELQINLIICASPVKDVYFINPAIFFNGNRIKQYPNNIKIYKPNKK